jgi:CRP-like cAMP-binding protein
MLNNLPHQESSNNKKDSSNSDFFQKMLATLEPFLFVKKVKKKELLLIEGNTCKNIYFIQIGAIKQYYVSDGKEFIQNFFFEGNMASHFNSFLSQTTSNCYLEALEDCDLLVLSFHNFQKACETHPGFNQNLAVSMAKMNTKRINLLLLTDALLRYKKLLRDEPSILQKVPQYMVASYLGMTPETLSRIRKKLTFSATAT